MPMGARPIKSYMHITPSVSSLYRPTGLWLEDFLLNLDRSLKLSERRYFDFDPFGSVDSRPMMFDPIQNLDSRYFELKRYFFYSRKKSFE